MKLLVYLTFHRSGSPSPVTGEGRVRYISTKKSAFADLGSLADSFTDWPDTLKRTLSRATRVVNRVWTRRELNPVDLGYQANLANLPSPHQINCSKYEIHQS